MPFQVIPTNLETNMAQAVRRWSYLTYAVLLMEEPTTNLNMSIELSLAMVLKKSSNEGSRAMKENNRLHDDRYDEDCLTSEQVQMQQFLVSIRLGKLVLLTMQTMN